MSELAAKDLRAVLDIVYGLHDDTDEIELPGHIIAQLGSLVGCDVASYSRVQHVSGQLLVARVDPVDMDKSRLPALHAVFDQHPGFAAYRSGQLRPGTSAALTDLAALRTLRRLPIYVEFYQPAGVNDQLLCVTRTDSQHGSVLAFNRERRGFSSRDRAVVDLVAPHVAQAVKLRQRLAALTAAVSTLGRHSEEVEQARPQLSVLTAREREVVEYLVGGVTDHEIARSLGISQRTVHKHLERIYRKLGLSNRTSLIALVHQANKPSLRATG